MPPAVAHARANASAFNVKFSIRPAELNIYLAALIKAEVDHRALLLPEVPIACASLPENLCLTSKYPHLSAYRIAVAPS